MKVTQPMRLMVAAAMALPYLATFAQDVTLPDLVKGEKLQSTIKAADLPADFKAVKLKVAGQSGFLDMLSGPLGMMMMLSGGMRSGSGNETAQAEVLSMLQLCWTNGKVVHLLSSDAAAAKAAGTANPSADDEYLVTYASDFDISQMMALSGSGGTKAFTNTLKLVLVKVTSIAAITPVPDVSKDQFAKVLDGAATVMATHSSDTAVPVADAPATEIAPAMAVGTPAASGNPGQTLAMSNGKQIALGMLMYTNDYDDVLPYVQSVVTVKEITYPYIKTKSVWETGNPASQWRFNMCVGGALETDIQEPASTPMFYESAPWPDGRRVVAFMDGHVKLVSSSDWKAMAKYLKLKLKKKATKPLPLHVPGYGSTG